MSLADETVTTIARGSTRWVRALVPISSGDEVLSLHRYERCTRGNQMSLLRYNRRGVLDAGLADRRVSRLRV